MVVSLKANKKRVIAFLVLAAVVAGACVFLRMREPEPQEPQEVYGETNEERVQYLSSFGWQVEEQAAETREVMIPAEFNDVYTTYNAMQQAQGFDLRPYAGQVCTQYKYRITNYPNETEVFATLLVYGRIVIGGDVACAEVDGFMHGFAPDSPRYGETTVNSGGESAKQTASPAPVTSMPPEGDATESAPAAETETQTATEALPETTEGQAESTTGEIFPEEAYPVD